jgi:SAM-dependent methyltransferase
MATLESQQQLRWNSYANSSSGLSDYEKWLALPGRRQIHELYRKHVSGKVILEVGCGAGHLMSTLLADDSSRQITGLDLSEGMLTLAAERGLSSLVQGSGNDLPFADHSFDTVVAAVWVFRYLDPERALAEARRVLRPGGQLLFDIPLNCGMFLEGLSEAVRHPARIKAAFRAQRLHLNPWSAGTWNRRLTAAGFCVEQTTGILELPFFSHRFNWAPLVRSRLIQHFCLSLFHKAKAP